MGRKHINLRGRTFWDLKVLRRDRVRSSRAYAYWICECSCGVRVSKRSDWLRNRLTHACPNCMYKYYEEEYNERKKTELERYIEKYGNSERKRRKKNMTKIVKLKNPIRDAQLYTGKVDALNQKIIMCREFLDMPVGDIVDYLEVERQYIIEVVGKYRQGKITYHEEIIPKKVRVSRWDY